MNKVIQIQTTTVGDNINEEQKMITTLLYDNGDIYEGWMETVNAKYDEIAGCSYDVKKKMMWKKLDLPQTA